MKGRWRPLLTILVGCILFGASYYERHERSALDTRGVTTTGRVESAWTTDRIAKVPDKLVVEYHVNGERHLCRIEKLPPDFLERPAIDLRGPPRKFGDRTDPGPLTVRYLPDDPSTSRVEHPRLPPPEEHFQGWGNWAFAGFMIVVGTIWLFEKQTPVYSAPSPLRPPRR